ncbi:MAG: TlpA family protein disulfide reductase [Gammaproteobacteria bacterium]|nr:TlpA family protein disulfide reductase [Gammaproteobacteria bacterium]
MTGSYRISFVVIGVLIALAGVFLWRQIRVQTAPQVSFTLTNGHSVSAASLRGRPVLVTFWSVSCSTCLAEIPDLIELYRQLGPRGLEIIGVAMPFDPPDAVMTVQRQQRINYKIALDVPGTLVAAFQHVILTPDSYLIDPQGKIVMHKQGQLDMLPLRLQIQSLLQQREG